MSAAVGRQPFTQCRRAQPLTRLLATACFRCLRIASCAAVFVFVALARPATAADRAVLRLRWTAPAGSSQIAATPRVAGGTVYVGSWDGYEYALDERSGEIRWRSYLGQTSGVCEGVSYTQGVTSEPWIEPGMAYVGGGGPNWYALNAGTGEALWNIPTGDNSMSGGHYNWSSPVVYRNHAYVGIASFCDAPPVQGQLLYVNLRSHAIEKVWHVVPPGHVGGTIWRTPALDKATNTLFVSTGERRNPADRYAAAVVALDARSLRVKDSWTLPQNEELRIDSDWGTSPLLFTAHRRHRLVAAVNKNGILYVFRRNRLRSGPIWRRRMPGEGHALLRRRIRIERLLRR